MKFSHLILLGLATIMMYSCESPQTETKVEPSSSTDSQEFYQLKIYNLDTDDQVQTVDDYLQQAYLPALKRISPRQVGVFKPRPNETDSLKKIYVLIPFTSMPEFLSLEEALNNDSTYIISGNAYLNAAFDNPPYTRIQSTLLAAFSEMPKMQTPYLEGPREDRIYELRSYESATERLYSTKVDMFNAGGEVKLFDRLKFNAVFYGEVISGSKMPNLMYMTTFKDQTSRDEHWEAFVDSPEWKEMSALPKYENTVSHVDIYFLYPTAYSDY